MDSHHKILREQIRALCTQKNAVIIAHVYQRSEVHGVADFVADSLALAQYAQQSPAEIIVVGGVTFMAQTVAILCPQKKILLPDLNAGCDMANMITVAELEILKAQHRNAVVVTYINSSAEIKAHSDICCTSANALSIVEKIPREREIIFIPDRNLGAYIAKKLSRKLILWENGFCPVHERLLLSFAEQAKREHPAAKLLMHPEARLEVLAIADYIGSTTSIIKYCRESSDHEFIIGTEIGILPILRQENPQKQFYPLTPIADCPAMKLITLPKILSCLENLSPVITVEESLANKARIAIEKMLQ